MMLKQREVQGYLSHWKRSVVVTRLGNGMVGSAGDGVSGC